MKKVNIIFIFLLGLLLVSCNDNQHTHDYSKEHKIDENNHWKACSCGEKIEVNSHTYDNDCDVDCNECGYKRTVTHTYGEWVNDETNHWKVCSCGEKGEITAHIPSEEATENTPQTCTICNYVIKEATGHIFKYQESNEKIEAVLGKDGKVVLTCDCGEEKTEVLHYYQWFECVNCKHKNPLREEIREAYFNKFNDGHLLETGYEIIKSYIQIYYYYGEYNGCHIINITYIQEYYEKEWLVENETLEYETLKELTAYYNGEFYSLTKALELNLITITDLEKVIEQDKLYYPEKYHHFTEEEKEYLADALGHYYNNFDLSFRGEYNEAYIIYSSSGAASMHKQTINNVVILYPSGGECQVVHDGKVYSIKEAFTNLILTEEDIEKISLSFRKYEDFDIDRLEEEDPIKLEEKIKSDITKDNITTSLVVTIDKNFQLLLTEEHFKDIGFETLSKIENNLENQQYLMTFQNTEEAYNAVIKLETLYYVLTINLL